MSTATKHSNITMINRYKNLNMLAMHFPLTAIISILHRLSGVVLFFLMPIMLWVLSVSLQETGFARLQAALHTLYGKTSLWLIGMPFIYHFIAGLRHLLMDIGYGTTRQGGRIGGWLVIVFSLGLVLLWGGYLLW